MYIFVTTAINIKMSMGGVIMESREAADSEAFVAGGQEEHDLLFFLR